MTPGYIKDEQGISYLELIVATAVLSIVLFFIARVNLFSTRFDYANKETTRMALEAQRVMEIAKAGGKPDNPAILSKTAVPKNDHLKKVTVTIPSTDPSISPFVLVSYRLCASCAAQPPSIQLDSNDWEYDERFWVIDEGKDNIYRVRGVGSEEKQNIFYKYKFNAFDYAAYLEHEIKNGGGGTYQGGIIFGTSKENYNWFSMARGTGQQKNKFLIRYKYANGNEIQLGAVDFDTSKKYFLEAVAAGENLLLRFGYLTDGGSRICGIEKSMGFFDTTQEYILGLKDTTSADATIYYSFP